MTVALATARRSPARVLTAPWVLAAALIAATALPLGLVMLRSNADTSWLLTAGERWLMGERLYVDVIEVNPPASIILYLPAILLARLLGGTPETAATLLLFLGTGASLALCAAVLRRAGLLGRRESGPLLCIALAVLLLVPTGDFGEREHIALLAALPWLAVLATRTSGRAPTPAAALLAGLGAGVAIAIKPMFALGFAGPLLLLAWRQPWRSLLRAPDLYAAGLLAALYGLSVPLLFPAFPHTVLGWVLTAYVPARCPWSTLLTTPAEPLWMGAVLCVGLLARRCRPDPLALALVLASLGFEAAYCLQGKGWSYQALPAVLLAILALGRIGTAVAAASGDRRATAMALAAAGLIALRAALLFAQQQQTAWIPGLATTIERLAPHPTMLAISPGISVGHPLVRLVGGRWVGSLCADWISDDVDAQEASGRPLPNRVDLERLRAVEHAILVHDITTARPDVILLEDGASTAAVTSEPALAAAVAAYRPAGHFDTLTLLVRADLLPPAPAEVP